MTASENGMEIKLSSKGVGGHDEFAGLLLDGGADQTIGVVLMHGRGMNQDGAVVGPLRRSLHQLGYATLSIANPKPKTGDDFPNYVEDVKGENYVFPEACARIRAAIAELKRRGKQSVIFVGFSMGARMETAFLSQGQAADLPVLGLIAISNGVNGIGPLDSSNSLGKVAVPVVDICGDGDADVAGSADKRKAAYEKGPGKSYKKILVTGGAPHNFAGFEKQLFDHVHGLIKNFN